MSTDRDHDGSIMCNIICGRGAGGDAMDLMCQGMSRESGARFCPSTVLDSGCWEVYMYANMTPDSAPINIPRSKLQSDRAVRRNIPLDVADHPLVDGPA